MRRTLLALALGLHLVGCQTTAVPVAVSPSPAARPIATPNLEATLEARVQATLQATAPTHTPAPQPTPIPPLAVPTGTPEAPPAAPRSPDLRGTVTRVVDGDTADVLLDGQAVRIRIIGIDTPETVAPGQPVDCFGPEASARARALLEGQTVSLTPDPTQDGIDAFGRLLVYVTLPDGRDYGEVMLREGYAEEYTFRTAYQKQAQYRAAQGTAQASDQGLWGACHMLVDPTPAPVPPAPVPAPTAAALKPAAPAPAPKLGYSGPYDPAGPDRDCGDFRMWQDAQAFFEAAGGPATDRHRLDSDRDGIACETLPGAP